MDMIFRISGKECLKSKGVPVQLKCDEELVHAAMAQINK